MRYWESKTSSKNKKNKSRSSSGSSSGKRSITMGGSVKDYPFLRKFYRHKVVISDSIQKFIFVLIIATLLYTFVLGDGGVVRLLLLRHRTVELEQDIVNLESDLELLKSEIDNLKNDPFYMEKIGRERFGYIKPDDHVIKIVPKDGEGSALDE